MGGGDVYFSGERAKEMIGGWGVSAEEDEEEEMWHYGYSCINIQVLGVVA